MIQTSVDGNLRVVTLDRPERRNAITRDGLADLEATLEAASEPVVFLRGAGSAFCAGADLSAVESLDRESALAFAREGQRVARALESYDGAVVAGIDGPARGGGVELALACDLRVATPEATVAENGVALGIFGAWGGTARLPAVVGQGEALDIALSGRVLDAEEARRVGLVSRIVEDPRAVAERIAGHDSTALRVIKRRIRDDGPQREQEEREIEAFADLLAGRDGSDIAR
jgi:enoyl-CoA hydratase/carnithine racemase